MSTNRDGTSGSTRRISTESESPAAESTAHSNRRTSLILIVVPIPNGAERPVWGLRADRWVFDTNSSNSNGRAKRRAFRSAPIGRKTANLCDRTDACGIKECENRGGATTGEPRERGVLPAVVNGGNTGCQSSESPDCRTNRANETFRM